MPPGWIEQLAIGSGAEEVRQYLLAVVVVQRGLRPEGRPAEHRADGHADIALRPDGVSREVRPVARGHSNRVGHGRGAGRSRRWAWAPCGSAIAETRIRMRA